MNVFEKIIQGEIPCSKILENERFLSFYDISPKAKVHALVIPKQSIQDFNGITPELMAQMTSFIFEVVEKLGIKEKGYKLLTNVGKNAGQEVMHLHFHILSEDKH